MKQAKVFINSELAGILTEDDMGYEFRYDSDYLKSDELIEESFLPMDLQKAYHEKIDAMVGRIS